MAKNISERVLDPVKRARPVSPGFYSVILHNDDYTTFDFVVTVLMNVCGLDDVQAFLVTKSVHQTGRGCAGTYTRDIAMTKQYLILQAAEQQEYPLLVTVEPG